MKNKNELIGEIFVTRGATYLHAPALNKAVFSPKDSHFLVIDIETIKDKLHVVHFINLDKRIKLRGVWPGEAYIWRWMVGTKKENI